MIINRIIFEGDILDEDAVKKIYTSAIERIGKVDIIRSKHMNLGIVGTGKIVADALYAMQPIKEIKIRSICDECYRKVLRDALLYF